jgi:hypothetical protein
MANVLPWMGCGVGTARSAAAATPLERGRLRVMLLTSGLLLHVRRELSDWPERDQRISAWFSLEVAAKLVAERDLAKLILGAISDKLMQKQVRRTKRSLRV